MFKLDHFYICRCELVFSSVPLNSVNWNEVTLEVDFQSRDVILSIGDVIVTQSFLCDDVLSTSSGQLGVVLGDEGWSCFFFIMIRYILSSLTIVSLQVVT